MPRYERPKDYEFSGRVKMEAIKRANYACEECGVSGYVEVHHMLGIYYAVTVYKDIAPWMISSLANAKVLCPTHHTEADNAMHTTHAYHAAKLLGLL